MGYTLNNINKSIRDIPQTNKVLNANSLMPYSKNEEDNLSLLLSSVKEYAIFMLDPEGYIMSWNLGARRIKGYTAKQIIGKHFSTFYPPEDNAIGKPQRALEIALLEGIYEEEGWRIRKDGSKFWASVVITPIYNKEKVLKGFGKVTRDLTEKKKMESALLLTQKKNIELTQSNQDLDEFAFTASHDLKEPLRGINTYLYILKKDYIDKLDLKASLILENMEKILHGMNNLLDSLLHSSRVWSQDLLMQQTDLNQILLEVLRSLSVSLNENNVQVRYPQPLPTVCCDPVRMGQVFHNLITNSIKYNDKKEKWVEIGYTDKNISFQKNDINKINRDNITFYVRDNGRGIRKKHYKDIFKLFNRLDDKEKHGAGIGLHIVKKIIERHNGNIWIESALNKGSSFYFTINVLNDFIS